MGWFDRQTPRGTSEPYPPNFTERTRIVLAHARDEATGLAHEYVGTEHILLALARQDEGVSAAVLDNLGVRADALRDRTLRTVQRGTAASAAAAALPLTSRAQKVLELAAAESRELGHLYVGTEHLLLGLVREQRGIAAQLLVDAGVTVERARAETLRLLGPSLGTADPPDQPA